MKVTIEFQLPDEKPEYQEAMEGGKAFSALHDLATGIRQKTKYGDEKVAKKWEEFSEFFWEAMENWELTPWGD